MVRVATLFFALALAAWLPKAFSDCPNKDLRCRIPVAEQVTQVSSSGCSAGGAANAGILDGVASGSVSLNGNCYYTESNGDGTNFVPVSTITVGTCYQYQFGDLTISDSCRPCGGMTVAQLCDQNVADCCSSSTVCTNSYTVVAGDDCWSIANNNGMTLDQLMAMNPGLNCDPLSINQVVCLAQGSQQGACYCEGEWV